MTDKGEFTVANAYPYKRSSVLRWILSHVLRYKRLLFGALTLYFAAWFSFSLSRLFLGRAVDEIVNPTGDNGVLMVALGVLGVMVADSLSSLIGSLSIETIAQRLARDSREELYLSLLGKSQTFHDQQRVGDIMARATDDVNQLNAMINPGVLFISELVLGFTVPVISLATLNWQLTLVPLGFIAIYIVVVRLYFNRLSPVIQERRNAFGRMNAALEETISGIEIVKASAQEGFERTKFYNNAGTVRDLLVQQGHIEARYLPVLFYGFALGFTFLHALLLYATGVINLGSVVAAMALVGAMRFPVFVSIFAFTLIQLGLAGGRRILELITASADMDENAGGHIGTVRGDIVFENVCYGYEDGMVLEDISFHVRPGETVAIVGQTGSGKSTLTDLINRTYDANEGRILIDGVDIRDWNLNSVRSQISRIEQDVFLFSRSVAGNIAFGAPDATQEQIEEAAKEAQAHDFIMSFNEGYETEIGERGVMLSGGQRQRLALARAFLSDPRILILDDSTSAIDSATEDEIQKAIRRAQEGRTTLLITHRLSQIRWADHILLLEQGRIVARGTHEELLRTSPPYRRIFARYDAALPPLEGESGESEVEAQLAENPL